MRKLKMLFGRGRESQRESEKQGEARKQITETDRANTVGFERVGDVERGEAEN